MKVSKIKISNLPILSREVSTLLNLRLTIKQKYWLDRLAINIQSAIEPVAKAETELREKYDLTKEEQLIKFNEEFIPLLEEEVEIEHADFKFEDYANVESDSTFPNFFKLLTIEE